jgi:ketosteroid isomerase-like protein
MVETYVDGFRRSDHAQVVGSPTITVTRMIEENDVVVAEGSVRVEKSAGGFLNAVFCDVFEMRGGRIRRLITYQVEVEAPASGAP